MTPGWQDGVERTSPCAPDKRWRQLPAGPIEIDGVSPKALRWPSGIDRWKEPIVAAGARHGVPPAWIAGIMGIETGGQSGLVSYAGAGGLMALMPATAAGMQQKLGLPVTPFSEVLQNDLLNLELGVAVLRDALDAYEGQFPLAAIAYNAGKVRCGSGSLCIPPGQKPCVRTPCPPNDWGAIMDCWLQKDGSLRTSDYPRRAVEYANTALERGFPATPGTGVVVVASVSGSGPGAFAVMLALAAGGYAGWWGMREARRRWTRSA
jgi:hypothetical protein